VARPANHLLKLTRIKLCTGIKKYSDGNCQLQANAMDYQHTSMRAGKAGSVRSLAAIMLALSSSTVVLAAAPTSPGPLQHAVYSSTAAEIFWNRSTDDGRVVSYEVKQNGQVVGAFDALSYFTVDLQDGNAYEFAVTAIDNDGDRSVPATVTFIGGDRDLPPVASAPAAPAGLQAMVYSSTAGELMWDRPATFGLSYEIQRDGAALASTQGVSFYENDLASGQTYTYTVVAVNGQGQRSAPSTVTLTTRGGSTPTVPQLAAPEGLVASVYSSRAAELFWSRPATFGLSYEVSRDGDVVANTNGISYFDDSLSAGSSHTFDVVAIDQQGRRSAPSVALINTPTGSSGEQPVDPAPQAAAITEPAGLFQRDGYGTVDVIRLDVKTVTTPGICTIDDLSGCTLADVNADIDSKDDFKVDIPIHFKGTDLPDDGQITNAGLRQRGGFTRLAPQKSYRVKLDSKEVLWRNERRLQMNKMPYDTSRIRNKVSFDLMQTIPHLPSLSTQFVNLWIDDGEGPEDYGLFTHTEYVGKEYLEKRGWDTDDHIYKIEEFVFCENDLNYLALDDDGEPLDIDRFETRLEIERGDDHRKLIEMIKAVNDNARSFESILDQYFDAENVLTWITVNLLLHQTDAITHNFYLYNPIDSDKFYFLPWDYDGTFAVEQEPANSLEKDELLRRLYYGYGKGRASNFLNRFYRMPGFHQKVLAKADQLRNNQLMDSTINQMTSQYAAVVSPYASRKPDIDNNASYEQGNSSQFASYVAQNHDALRNYGIPLPPKWRTPKFSNDQVTFRWEAAHDFNGNTVTYDVEVSSSPGFEAGNLLVTRSGIAESERDGYNIDLSQIGSGKRYARLVARVTTNPDKFWQTASNRPECDGEIRVGVLEFDAP